MAKSKADLLKDAQTAGLVAETVEPEDVTVSELETMLATDRPAWEGSLTATEPIVAPDGHVVLSQEDIDARA